MGAANTHFFFERGVTRTKKTDVSKQPTYYLLLLLNFFVYHIRKTSIMSFRPDLKNIVQDMPPPGGFKKVYMGCFFHFFFRTIGRRRRRGCSALYYITNHFRGCFAVFYHLHRIFSSFVCSFRCLIFFALCCCCCCCFYR
jgi:hypothetical protein